MNIYIIRHGQTTGDVEDRFGGAYDDHLTPLGINQCKMMADKFLNANIEVIYASPLIRTQETAKILQAAIGVEIETVDGLKERNQNGILTGMIRSEAKAKYPQMFEDVRDPHNTIEGAESFEELRKRVVEAINRIANSGYETVAVVTHGGPIRRILGDILQMEGSWSVDDCAWLQINYKDGVFDLVKKEGMTA
jgi:broad specificity phosphatase PhoE